MYRAIAEGGPVTPVELATRTGTAERYVREWLAQQAAAGYVEYDAATGRYSMTPEQESALAVEGARPACWGRLKSSARSIAMNPRSSTPSAAAKAWAGTSMTRRCFVGRSLRFPAGYAAHLVNEWLPALDGVREKLERGARVADVGCGHGASTILMAQAYPKSTFVGFDYHQRSVEHARSKAEEAGVSDRVSFEVAKAKDYSGNDL